jgi:ankyrin repeat protein
LLHSYAIANLLEPVKFLVEKKAFDVNAADRSGGTPLIYAVQFKSYEVAEYLLSKGAIQSKGWGVYPIHDAVMNYDLEMLKLLVKHGADVNSKDDSGYTPLYKAINYTDGTDDIIEYLRSIGAE